MKTETEGLETRISVHCFHQFQRSTISPFWTPFATVAWTCSSRTGVYYIFCSLTAAIRLFAIPVVFPINGYRTFHDRRFDPTIEKGIIFGAMITWSCYKKQYAVQASKNYTQFDDSCDHTWSPKRQCFRRNSCYRMNQNGRTNKTRTINRIIGKIGGNVFPVRRG